MNVIFEENMNIFKVIRKERSIVANFLKFAQARFGHIWSLREAPA